MRKKSGASKADRLKDLLNVKATDADETSKEEIVMQDECGDTLWDAVLKQEEKNLLSKSTASNVQPGNHHDKIK